MAKSKKPSSSLPKFCRMCFKKRKSVNEYTSHNLHEKWGIVCPLILDKFCKLDKINEFKFKIKTRLKII
jgi:hypothetical protein